MNTNSLNNSSYLNNTKSQANSHIIRTPLQPKSVHKNIQIDSNAKLTPVKTFDPTGHLYSQVNIKEKDNQFHNKNEKLVNLNSTLDCELTQRHEEDRVELNINKEDNFTLNEIISECNYNINKDCESNHFSSGSGAKISISSPFANLNLNSTSEKSREEDEDETVKKAIDFFEHENLIYVTNTDIRNRENIEDYVHEGLCFCEEEESRGSY